MVDQLGDNPPPFPRRPISTLAVISLVLALIPMCVPLNLLGCLVGLIARRRIVNAGGALGGAGAATAAVWGGVIMFTLGLWGCNALSDWAQTQVRDSGAHVATDFMRAVQDGDHDAARRWWSASADPLSDEALDAFADAIAGVGEIQQVGVRSLQPVPAGLLTPQWSASLTFVGGDVTHRGAARFEMQVGATTVDDVVRLRRVVFTGPDGDIVIPIEQEDVE